MFTNSPRQKKIELFVLPGYVRWLSVIVLILATIALLTVKGFSIQVFKIIVLLCLLLPVFCTEDKKDNQLVSQLRTDDFSTAFLYIVVLTFINVIRDHQESAFSIICNGLIIVHIQYLIRRYIRKTQ